MGVGAGVPLGVLLVSGLAILLIHERKRRIKAEKTIVNILAKRDTSHIGWIGKESHRWKRHISPVEVENTQVQPREIYGGEVYEISGTF